MSHRPGWPSTRGNPLTLWFAAASTLTGGGGADRSHRQAGTGVRAPAGGAGARGARGPSALARGGLGLIGVTL